MKTIVSIFLSFMLLLSSSGLTYAQHFCGANEMMAKITLGEEQMSCGMVTVDDCGSEEGKEDHGCCDNKYTSVDTDDNYSVSSFDLQINPIAAIAMVSVFIAQQPEVYKPTNTVYIDYSPPPQRENLQVLYETFLI